MGRCGERTDTQAAPGLAHLQGLVGSGSCPAPCSDNLFLAETAVCSYWSRTSRAWVSHQREAIGTRVHSPLKCELSRTLAGLCVVLPLSGDFLCQSVSRIKYSMFGDRLGEAALWVFSVFWRL